MQVPKIVPGRERAINVPAPLLAWIALLVLVQAWRAALPVETDLRLLLETAFVPAPWSLALGTATPEEIIGAAETAGKSDEVVARASLARYFAQAAPRAWSPVSFSLLHGSWTHLGFSCLLLVVFGAAVVRQAGPAASLALWLAAAMGGAFAHWLIHPLAVDLLIGSSASVSGFMAAAATFAFARPDDGRWSFLTNRAALALLSLWVGGNLFIGLVAAPLGIADQDISWEAHIGGLLVGLVLYPVLAPSSPSAPRHFTT